MSRWLTVTFGICLLSVFAASQEPITFQDRAEIMSHERSGRYILRLSDPAVHGSTSKYVALQIVVGANGSVISAKPLDGDPEYFVPAVRAAMQRRFEPFRQDGRPTKATFLFDMPVAPPEKRLRNRPPMPEIADWDSLRITLRRMGGYNSPEYRLLIHGDGHVEYTADKYTHYCGQWRGSLPLSSVRELVAEFRAADYFSLYSEYLWDGNDAATAVTSISFDARQKKVVDYAGNRVGMPESVSQLEDAIDRLAGPEHWLTREKVQSENDTGCDARTPASPVNPETESIRATHS